MTFITDFETVVRTSADIIPLQTAPREGAPDPEPFRWHGVVDSHGNQVGTVTDRYTNVNNVTLAKALGDALYDHGIGRDDITRGRALYRAGRTRFDLHLNTHAFSVPGDPSEIKPIVQVDNGFGGLRNVTLRIGLFRILCTNGMVSMVRAMVVKMRHTGDLSQDTIYAAIYGKLGALLRQAADQREVAALLADTSISPAWVERILEEVADRYASKLEATINRNVADLGGNAWALTQAISEHATHERPQGWAAETWATTEAQRVLSLVRDARS